MKTLFQRKHYHCKYLYICLLSWTLQAHHFKPVHMVLSFLPSVVSWCDTGSRFTRNGHVWHIRSLCQSLSTTRQKEETWNKSSQENTQPSLQWKFHL